MLSEDLYYKVGYICRAHGLKGGVTALLEPDAEVNWADTRALFIEISGQFVPYLVEQCSVKGTRAYLKFKGINRTEDTVLIQKRNLYLPKSERPRRTGLEFYDDEILGFKVIDANLGMLGTIIRIDRTGPGRHLIVPVGGAERMIPVNSPFILKINRKSRTITVELPEGFLDV